MNALLPAFVAAALSEIGDKTQFLAAILAVRFRRPALVMAGIAVAALANSLIAGLGGAVLPIYITHRAITLMLALALVGAGAGMFGRSKPPKVGVYERLGPFAASAIAFFILEFGDKTQFLTFALAAHAQSPLLAAAGAAAGVLLASAPAVALGEMFATAAPIRPIRTAAAVLFLLFGCILALVALRLL